MRNAAMILASLLLATTAYGASTKYAPDRIERVVSPGEVLSVPLSVSTETLEDALRYYYGFWVPGDVVGDIPREWLSAWPFFSYVTDAKPVSEIELTIAVPASVKPGQRFSGVLFTKAYRSWSFPSPPSGWVPDEGSGVLLDLSVASEGCDAVATVDISSFGPDILWPPTGRLKDVTVTGTVEVPDGCELTAVGYTVNDEYDEFSTVEELTLEADGSFTVVIPLSPQRLGGDRDGRYYEISILAETAAGISSSEILRVTVPHDQRGKK